MSKLDLVTYQLTTNSYGQLRATPLLLANELLSELEQWFQNCKFNYLATSNLSEEKYNESLQMEYFYSSRVKSTRNFSEVKADVTTEMDLLNYHQLVKIVHFYIERFYKVYSVLLEPRQGNNILDFEKHIDNLLQRFHKSQFPDKIDFIENNLNLKSLLNILKHINKVRNCLEHRHGIVSKVDCKDDDFIEIYWRYPKVSSADGDFSPISEIKGMETQKIEFVDEVKKFYIGEKIIFDFYDNYKCLYSIVICFKLIIDGLYNKLNINQNETPTLIRVFEVMP